ncbi:DUF6000 family protein [Streptomyces sp. NPDC047085]|uniref:DUF6000 family protein n=1 Tax=Streptomyces sp. NPDC047085 TaxID=3155140 RepID=UPI0033C77013
MPREEYVPFVHALAADARAVSDAELTTLFEGSWRERRTAAWLAAVSRRDHFRERLGALLLESEVCCAGGAYRVAPASFGTARDADLLAACLDRYLRRPDLAYDQPTAMGALAYTDSVLHGDRAGRLLQGGGLWRRSRARPTCSAMTASPCVSACAPTAPRSWSPSRTAAASPPSHGPT